MVGVDLAFSLRLVALSEDLFNLRFKKLGICKHFDRNMSNDEEKLRVVTFSKIMAKL